jgi:hypothetical protein
VLHARSLVEKMRVCAAEAAVSRFPGSAAALLFRALNLCLRYQKDKGRGLPLPLYNLSPNLATLGSHHRVARLAAEGLREHGHVRERAVDAEARQRVWVGFG